MILTDWQRPFIPILSGPMLVRIPGPRKGVYVGRHGVRKFFENIIRNLTITIFDAREFVTEAQQCGHYWF